MRAGKVFQHLRAIIRPWCVNDENIRIPKPAGG
jgi:hypothetical protein